MQKTTSLPEAPAVAAPSASSTNPWLSGANSLFRLPGNAPFSQQPQTPTLCPSPWKILLPAAPFPCPYPGLLPSFRKSADSFSVTLASKKRIALRRTILSRRIPALVALASPASSAKRPESCRPFAVPLPRRAFPAEPPRPITESAGSLPPLSCSRSLAEKKASSADAAVPLPPRSVRRGQAASPGKRPSLIPPCRKSRKKKTARAKTQTV